MRHVARLRRIGGSVLLAIPKQMVDALALGPGATVWLSVMAGRLVVESKRHQRHTLDHLIGESKRSRRNARSENTWVAGDRAGRELI